MEFIEPLFQEYCTTAHCIPNLSHRLLSGLASPAIKRPMQFRWWLLNSFSTPYSENWLERRYILGLAIVKGSISKWVFWVINISTFFSYCLPVHWCWPVVLEWWNCIFKLSINWPLIISCACCWRSQLGKRVLPLLCFMDEDLFTFRFTNRPTGS